MSQKKLGRPTDDPKPHKLQLRVNDVDLNTLDEYCAKKKISRTEGIRDGIRALKEK